MIYDCKIGNKNLAVDGLAASDSRVVFTYDPAGSFSDGEILVLAHSNMSENSTGFRVCLRVGGSAGSEDLYYVNLDRDPWYRFSINKYVSGSQSTLYTGGGTGNAYRNGTPIWIRFRVVDTDIKLKVWNYNDAEPYYWAKEITDSSLSSGKAGLGFYDKDSFYRVMYFGVETSGGTVPVPDLTSGGEYLTLGGMHPYIHDRVGALGADGVRMQLAAIPEELDGKYLKGFNIAVTDWGNTCRFAVYKGGTSSTNPNGATLIEDLGVLSLTEHDTNYIRLSSLSQVSTGEQYWLALKTNNSLDNYYASSHSSVEEYSGFIADGEASGCRYILVGGPSVDETIAYPATITSTTTSAISTIGAKLVFSNSGTTTTTTTTTSTTIDFSTDFSEYSTDSDLTSDSNWAVFNNSGNGTAYIRDDGDYGGKCLELKQATTNEFFMIEYTPIGTQRNVDVLIRFRYILSLQFFPIVSVRSKTDADGFSGIATRGARSYGGTYFGKYIDGVYEYFSVTSTYNALNTWYWLRVQAQGNLVRMKMWPQASSEPGTWTITDHDYTPGLASGKVTIGTFSGSTSDIVDIDYFSVVTGGGSRTVPTTTTTTTTV